MRRRLKLYAKWKTPGDVEWQVYGLGGGWSMWGKFDNCVSRQCLMERVLHIIRAPREAPGHVYRVADVAVDHLVGLIGDVKLASYMVKLGIDIGAGEAFSRPIVDAVLTKLTGKLQKHDDDEEDDSGYPELFVGMKLTYDAYDCPDSDELCEGWWADVWASYDLEHEWAVVEWSGYMGPDLDSVDVETMRRAAYKAIRHAYNAPVRL
jgi:hypothetical protein